MADKKSRHSHSKLRYIIPLGLNPDINNSKQVLFMAAFWEGRSFPSFEVRLPSNWNIVGLGMNYASVT